MTPYAPPIPTPAYRRLRILLDPSLSLDIASAAVNRVTAEIPWESLEPGPVGEYLEVIDHDPASGCFYLPVDLNDPMLLAQEGHRPSSSSPQFHQQMVYAVAMLTIRCFERALGRVALWRARLKDEDGNFISDPKQGFIRRLAIFPHAVRDANAYYSPEKRALLFGYFPASTDAFGNASGGTIFTCQSFDIIAHETTHALLDGLHPRYLEATNPDMMAFHEAFADIVAMLQHFSFPEFTRNQIARARGDLASDNRLVQLAREFGEGTGNYGALRDAIGKFDRESGKWTAVEPHPEALENTLEAHARGAILVAAVFDAFLSIYKVRTADLLRLATGGTGVLPPGSLSPDLVNRLSAEAERAARHLLSICIRALDYCPPVDLTFGEYLRALVTADYDVYPEDHLGYRIAIVSAFLKRGIIPEGVPSRSDVDSMRWKSPTWDLPDHLFKTEILQGWELNSNREQVFEKYWASRAYLHRAFAPYVNSQSETQSQILDVLGLMPGRRFEVHSIRPARRLSQDGRERKDLVVEIIQTMEVDLESLNALGPADPAGPEGKFRFRGGCTLLIDLETGTIRYCIRKSITNKTRRGRQADFLEQNQASLASLYLDSQSEPFARLHKGGCYGC